MWDSEGKDVDNQVVEKLFSTYHDFFSKNKLGKDFFITYRVPNPSVQKEQGKILLETLHSIPRAFDVAKAAGSDGQREQPWSGRVRGAGLLPTRWGADAGHALQQQLLHRLRGGTLSPLPAH